MLNKQKSKGAFGINEQNKKKPPTNYEALRAREQQELYKDKQLQEAGRKIVHKKK